MKKRISLLLAILMLFAISAGCNDANDPANPSSGDNSSSNQDPSTNGNVSSKDDVVIGLSVSLKSIEPMNAFSREEQYITANVFDTLIEMEDGEYQMELATSMDISDDLKTARFTLRDDVYFHNGEKFTAQDVVYTLTNLANFPFWTGHTQYISGAKAIDDYTVEVYAPDTNVYFLVALSSIEMINEKAVTELGEEHSYYPVGTGPYKVDEYDGYNNFYLSLNEDYFKWKEQGEPAIKKINYRIIEDQQTMAMALEAGEVDFVAGVKPTDAIPFESMPGFTVDWVDSDGVELILYNCGRAPFDNKLVRQAVAYAIDRESYNIIVAEGKYKVWDYYYSEKQAAAPDYDDLPHYTYDVEKAKELLTQAGYPDGFKLELPVIIQASQEKGAIAIQQQLAQVGIEFDIEILEQNTLYDNIFAMNYQMLCFGLSTETLDMSYQTKNYYSPELKSMPFPCGDYSNEAVDELIRASETTADLNERKEIYTELYTLLFEEQPVTGVGLGQYAIVKKENLVYTRPDLLKVKVERLYWTE